MPNLKIDDLKDPASLLKMDKEKLVELYVMTCQIEEDTSAQKLAIKDALHEKLEGDGEIISSKIGEYSVVKARRLNFNVDLEKAKELGAVKESVDNSALKKLFMKGIKIPHTVTKYLLIKEVLEK